MYIKNEYKCTHRMDLEATSVTQNEIVEIEINGLLLISFYRPSNSDITFVNNFRNVVDRCKEDRPKDNYPL